MIIGNHEALLNTMYFTYYYYLLEHIETLKFEGIKKIMSERKMIGVVLWTCIGLDKTLLK